MTNYYSAKHDRGLLWNDPVLGIFLPVDTDKAALSQGQETAAAFRPVSRFYLLRSRRSKSLPLLRQSHRMGEAFTERLHNRGQGKGSAECAGQYACRHCERTGISTPVVVAPMPPLRRRPSHPSTNMLTACRSTAWRKRSNGPAHRSAGVLGDRFEREAPASHLRCAEIAASVAASHSCR